MIENLKETSKEISRYFGNLMMLLNLHSFTLEEKELTEFEKYISVTESAGFVQDPTMYGNLLNDNGFDRLKRRIEIIRMMENLKKELNDDFEKYQNTKKETI